MSAASAADRTAIVALLRRVGLDAPGIAERVELEGPLAALERTLGAETSLLPEDPAPLIAAAETAIGRWRAAGLGLLTVLDDEYPANLRAVHDRPALLFVAGDAELLRNEAAVAVVGSRRPSPVDLVHAARYASELADAGQIVLSGLAAGIDAATHQAAIDAGGRTVAVLGTGLEHVYPREHVGLQARLAGEHALVSPFWPEDEPDPERFRRRNGVMSGLSRGTVIIAASARSGTRVQARLALAHGRPVFLLASLLGQPWAADLAGRPGVHVVESPAEVLAVTVRAPTPLTAPIG